MTRPRKNSIQVVINTIAGKILDITSRGDGKAVVYDETTDQYKHVDFPTGGVTDWSEIQNKPTTLEGYGINNAYNKTFIGNIETADFVAVFEAALV